MPEENTLISVIATNIDPISKIASEMGTPITPGNGFSISAKGNHKVYVKPFLAFKDVNNQNEQDILDCNPRVPSVSVGLKFSF